MVNRKRGNNYLLWIIMGSIILILIITIIILYAKSQNVLPKTDNTLFTDSNSAQSANNEPIDCTKAFNNCIGISRAKGNSITLVNKDYIDNPNQANTFYKIWRGSNQPDDLDDLRIEAAKMGETLAYPLTMFVIKYKYGSLPSEVKVVICNSDGTLLKTTSSWACG